MKKEIRFVFRADFRVHVILKETNNDSVNIREVKEIYERIQEELKKALEEVGKRTNTHPMLLLPDKEIEVTTEEWTWI